MKFLEILKYRKSVIYKGSLQQFEDSLFNYKSGNAIKLRNTSYKLLSNFSLGTVIVNNNPGLVEGIKVEIAVSKLNENELELNFSTRIRIEHYFFAGIFLLITFILLITSVFQWKFLFILLFWPLVHLWFQFIYRSQEEYLVNNFIKSLKKK